MSGNIPVTQTLAAALSATYVVSGSSALVITVSLITPQPVSGGVVIGVVTNATFVRLQAVVGSAALGVRPSNSQINQGTSIYGSVSLGVRTSATGSFGRFWQRQVVNQPSWRDVTIGEFTDG